MDTERLQRIVMMVLAGTLLLGSVKLYFRDARPFYDIAVEKAGMNRDKTLGEIYEEVKEESRIDINSARADELCRIPGVGKKTAEKIIRYRDSRGRITSLREMLAIPGIGEKKLEKIGEYIRVD